MSERVTDADGTWEATPQPSGAVVRVLVEPSEAYLTERETAAREKAIADLPDTIAARRYEAEVAGITVNGTRVQTDRETRAILTGAALQAGRQPERAFRWKGPDGFVPLDSPTVLAIADAVSDYVQACFDREAALLAEVDEAEDPLGVDIESDWPSREVTP